MWVKGGRLCVSRGCVSILSTLDGRQFVFERSILGVSTSRFVGGSFPSGPGGATGGGQGGLSSDLQLRVGRSYPCGVGFLQRSDQTRSQIRAEGEVRDEVGGFHQFRTSGWTFVWSSRR